MTERFQMVIRSPHEVVLDSPLRAVRLPTETGLVGVRPRAERMVLPSGRGLAGLLVVGSDLGLCGSYNARLVALAARHREVLGPGPTVCVGRRTAMLLGRQGFELRRTFASPASTQGIPALLLSVAEDALVTYVAQNLSRLDVVSARFGGVGAERFEASTLLPLSSSVAGAKRAPGSAAGESEPAPAVRYCGREHVASVVAREVLYIALYDLLLGALASEHAARLVATQSAESSLDERAAVLRRRLTAARRESSTQEIIEIVGHVRDGRETTPVSTARGRVSPS